MKRKMQNGASKARRPFPFLTSSSNVWIEVSRVMTVNQVLVRDYVAVLP
jgi:hypothetical protein